MFLSLILFFFLFLCVFWPSGTESSSPALLDYSWQLVMEYAYEHGLKFGRDIVYTYGPLGFLDSDISLGHLISFRVGFAVVWAGIVAFSTIQLTRKLPSLVRWFFIGWTVIFAPLGGLELHIYQVLGYCAWLILLDAKRRGTIILLSLLCLVFLSLIKFTMFVAAVTTIVVCIIVKVAEKQYREAIFLSGGFMFLLVSGWVAIGQDLSLILPWLHASLEIAKGFTPAMSYRENSPVTFYAFLATVAFFFAILLSLHTSRRRPAHCGMVICLACYGFFSWKHAIIRPDPEHFFWLFVPVPLIFSCLWISKLGFFPGKTQRWAAMGSYFLTIAFSLIGMETGSEGIIIKRLAGLPQHLMTQTTCISNLITGQTGKVYGSGSRQWESRSWVPDMTKMRSIVKNEPVDVFNYQQWVAIENGFNYVPRPVMQGYNAYTPYLAELNDRFYRSSRAPTFVMMNMETIDGRFPSLDDSRALLTLFHRYRLVASENSFLLLTRKEEVPYHLEAVLQRNLRFGEPVDISPWNSDVLLLAVNVKPSLAVSLRRFFFKEPLVTMSVNDAPMDKGFRYIPSMGTSPFLLSPLLENNEDVISLYDEKYTKKISTVSFIDHTQLFSTDQDSLRITLYKLHRL
jgi:hypothetical protein